MSFVLGFSIVSMTPFTEQAHAQSWGGGARGTAARAIGQKWKVGASSAEIYAGPSSAYSKRGRVYDGEEVMIIEVTQSQEWAQVTTAAGIRGWVKVSELKRPQDQIAQDPGRYRRQTDYQYDAQGRRMGPGGQAAGSGQGIDQGQGYPQGQGDPQGQGYPQDQGYPQGQDATLDHTARDQAFARVGRSSPLSIGLPIGGSYFTRRFTSNIGTSPLSGLKSQALSPAFGLNVVSQINDFLNAEGRFLVMMGAKVPLPAIAAIPDVPAVDVSSSQQLADLKLNFGTPLSLDFADELWLGAVIGAQYFASKYTEVQYPTPAEMLAPLQNHTYISALLGSRASMTWGITRIGLSGGVALPLSFEQSPNSEGKWKSLGLWGRVVTELSLSRHLTLGLSLAYLRIGTDYTGPAAQADYSLSAPVFYTEASGYDQNLEAVITTSYRL